MFIRLLTILIILLYSNQAGAVLTIDITRGNVDPMPIALPYLGSDDTASKDMGKQIISVVENDLESSGLFRSIDRGSFIQEIKGSDTVPQFADWRQINASALFTGGLVFLGDKDMDTSFRLWDVYAEQQIAGKSFSTNRSNWRRISHLISDEIYKRLTGEGGYFDTRIVYVAESGPALKKIKRLAIMDQDGANHRYITDGSYMALTPRFSPTAQEVIFMSYEKAIPSVYMIDVDSLKKHLVGNFPGMSFAPRFSDDGKKVIMSVSTDGNSEIYDMEIATGKKRRLTRDGAIDTSPCFSPDGSQIVFNSDRGGSQQLYTMNSDGSNVKRISLSSRGRYGTPVWSPRGDLIAFTKISGGRFYIGVMRPDGSGERLLTESFMDEGPTWSPNGRVIMFARQTKGYGDKAGTWSIHSVDLTGYNEKKVKTPNEASDPAWSPLL